jgi:dienelactone hydrolase
VPPTPPGPHDLTSQRTARRGGARERAGSQRAPRRQRLLAVGLVALAVLGTALIVALASTGPAARRRAPGAGSASHSASTSTHAKPVASTPQSAYAVGLTVLRLVDTSRTIALPDGSTEPRTLLTYVRYPALGSPGRTDLPNATPASADGPFPLVVFGHGFAVTPGLYQRLLQSWASAGYVVAAPAFPLENANAPGGPNESDLTNQPADMSFVISRVLAAAGAGSGPLSGLVDQAHIAVSGQSDGGDTALAVAYNSRFHDPRVSAAVILSGAEMPGVSGFTFAPGSPPLLATQGTADTVNPPNLTSEFFESAKRPKYLLRLLGAEHLPPYSNEQPQLGIVERVTIAFLDGYLKHRSEALRRISSLGTAPGAASLLAEP